MNPYTILFEAIDKVVFSQNIYKKSDFRNAETITFDLPVTAQSQRQELYLRARRARSRKRRRVA